MKPKLLTLITILLIPALLAGCVATLPAAPATVPAENAAKADHGCAAGFRLFDHEQLATEALCIPIQPERVAPLDVNSFEFMLVAGIKPAIASDVNRTLISNTNPDWVSQVDALTAGLPDPGFDAPNFEVLLAAAPDLIITQADYFDDATLALLAEIAPTVVFAPGADLQDWRPHYRFVAAVLGQEEVAAALIADYDARIAALQAALGADFHNQTVSVVYARRSEELAMRLAGSFSGTIFRHVGITPPAAQQKLADEGAVSLTLSNEAWSDADADHLFIYAIDQTPEGTAAAQAKVAALADDPLWNALTVVQNDQAYQVGPHWHGFGLLSAHRVIDDLFTYLLAQTPAPANPLATPPDRAPAADTATGNVTAVLIPVVQIEGFPPYAPAQPLLEEVVSRSADTIVAKHAYGETAIPANPQRIFVNDPATLQILLSLGINPVGSTTFTPELPLALQEQGVDVTLIQDTGEGVNLEKLAALQPDLILGHAKNGPGMISAEQYAIFSQIAPTIAFTGNPFFYWKEATLDLADFFGVPEKAVAVLTAYNTQVADYRAQAQAALGNETVTILLLFDTTMWLYSVGGTLDGEYIPLSPTGWAYRELGLPPGPEVAALAGEELWAEISLELIPELKADHLVVFPNAYGGEEIGQGLDDYFDSPLWQTVPAVQNGKIHVLTADNAIEGYRTTPYLIEAFLATLNQ